jgi:hypothetical protein
MASLDPVASQKLLELVAGMDAEIARRRVKKDAAEDAAWLAEFQDEVILFAKRLERQFDRRKPGAVLPRDRDALQAMEDEIVELTDIATHIEILERMREDRENGVERRRFKPAIRVKSMARLLPEAKQRLDPGAAKPERTGGRRGESAPPAMSMGQPIAEDGVWLRGQVLTWNPRDHIGSVRAQDGREFVLAAGILMRSGLTTLIVGQKCQFHAVGSEADVVKAAWH